MRADGIKAQEISHILAGLLTRNRIACEVSLATGLRINDVLRLKPEIIKPGGGVVTVTESKTGKRRRVYISAELMDKLAKISGRFWIFEGRLNPRKHRTRQAVYKDLRLVAQALRCPAHISPHSCRKAYAIREYHRTGSIKRVQELLQHESEAVTLIYAMADELTKDRLRRKKTPRKHKVS